MAAPIGHIYLAIQLLNGPFQQVDSQKFLIGTSFPDIRYPANLSREFTHKQNVTFSEITQESDPFRKGMLFHAFVDEKRDTFIKRTNIEKTLPPLPHITGILKGLEDQILFTEIANRSFIRLFDEILEQEQRLVLNRKIIEKWHTSLQNYFFYGPTPKTVLPFIKQNIPSWMPLQNITEQVASYGFYIGTELIKLNKDLIDKIKNFYQTFYAKNIAAPLILQHIAMRKSKNN